MNSNNEIIKKTQIIRKPSSSYFIKDNFLVEMNRKTKKRKNLLEVKTERGFFYFLEGYNLKPITISRVKVVYGHSKIIA